MTEEPYRWLEAINNRREYIRDQIAGGTPVFAVSRPEGILLMGVGHGQSKIFEIYDRHGFAALGHPVDIEKLRQAAIEAAHMEGFARSSSDVTLRRLISFSLSTTLKNSFEQVYSPPFLVECIFGEVASDPEQDVLVRVNYDGNHRYETGRGAILVAHNNPKREADATAWLQKHIKPKDSLRHVVSTCLTIWKALMEKAPIQDLKAPSKLQLTVPDKIVEAALLDRNRPDPVHYRTIDLTKAKN